MIRSKVLRSTGGARVFTLRAKDATHPVLCRAGSSDLAVFHQIFVEREYEPLDDLEAADLIVDCGANVGYSAAYFLSRFPTAELIAVEPDPANFDLLEHNLRPYGARARALRAAIWSHPCELAIEEEVYGDGREWSRQVRPARDAERSGLRGVDIGTLLRESSHETISLLKIDIEGSETVVFADNCDFWLDRVESIVIELHDDSKFGVASAVFEKAIAGRGLSVTRSGELTFARRRAD